MMIGKSPKKRKSGIPTLTNLIFQKAKAKKLPAPEKLKRKKMISNWTKTSRNLTCSTTRAVDSMMKKTMIFDLHPSYGE
jgi:hypothetical protein